MDIEKIIYLLNEVRKKANACEAEGVDWAIKIIEKQKPKRALLLTFPVFMSNGRHEEVKVNSCPTCFQTVEHSEFCPHCGQRMAWKDIDEIVTR